MRQNDKRPLAGLVLAFAAGTAGAQALDDREALQIAQANGDAAVAQYEQLLKETEGLQVYNELVQRQIEAQQQEIQSYQDSLALVPELERQLPPLLIRMVDGLADFVERDIPFLREERMERVAELQLLVERSDVTDAEKLRRILEAWQIETEYGGSYTTYRGRQPINGEDRQVDYLQVGRVGFYYQTTDDDALTGAWDVRNGGWIELGSEYRNSVGQALRMALNQIAPELVLLPVPPPEE
jgi:hypothetical protein